MEEDKISLFVPGRLCLFGEHSDWAGMNRIMNAEIAPGLAIVTGIEQGIYAEAEKSDRFEIVSDAPELAEFWTDFSSPMFSDALKTTAKSDSFFANCAGAASYMRDSYHVGGVKIRLTRMTLPIKKGLSSSAAVCVLVVRAFNILYRLNLNTTGEMGAAFLGEQRTRSRCGRLDQACAFGVRPVLMEFDGNEIDVKPLTVREQLHFVFADLGAGKDTVKILTDLSRAFPFAKSENDHRIHEALGAENRRIVTEAVSLMKTGDREKLGMLMTEAQALFDEKVAPLSPEELASPILHRTLADPRIRELTFGGKGVGSQGDGSVQFLARNAESQRELLRYLAEGGMTPYPLTLGPTRVIRKAVIPVAGLGTRLYPAARAVRKEFFPVVDADGLAKPAILILLEQLAAAGIEEICLVVGDERDQEFYEDFFVRPPSDSLREKLPPHVLEVQRSIQKIGQKLVFAFQRRRRGFGHAVFQSHAFAGEEPVLLLLCDTLYRSHGVKNCSAQLIEAYERYNLPMLAIHPIPLPEVERYGVVAGVWEDSARRIMNLETIVEKPSADGAEEFLAVAGQDGKKEFYSVFGQYIITPEVYAELERRIAEADRAKMAGDTGNADKTGKSKMAGHADNAAMADRAGKSETPPSERTGEIELTDALESVRAAFGMVGVVLDGEMFDIGTPQVYRRTVADFGIS